MCLFLHFPRMHTEHAWRRRLFRFCFNHGHSLALSSVTQVNFFFVEDAERCIQHQIPRFSSSKSDIVEPRYIRFGNLANEICVTFTSSRNNFWMFISQHRPGKMRKTNHSIINICSNWMIHSVHFIIVFTPRYVCVNWSDCSCCWLWYRFSYTTFEWQMRKELHSENTIRDSQ